MKCKVRIQAGSTTWNVTAIRSLDTANCLSTGHCRFCSSNSAKLVRFSRGSAMLEPTAGRGFQTTLQYLCGMSGVDWRCNNQERVLVSQTSTMTNEGTQNGFCSTRDPRSSAYVQPQSSYAVYTGHPESGWWNTEPSEEPWKASWDTAAPNDFGDFLHDLLEPSDMPKPTSCSRLQKQDLPAFPMAPHLPAKASDRVCHANASHSRGMAEDLGGLRAAPAAIQHPSLETLSDRSPDSRAATTTVDLRHTTTAQPTEGPASQAVTATAEYPRASRAQPRAAVTASIQTRGSRKRSRPASQPSNPQTDSAPAQPAVGRAPKRMKGPIETSLAKTVLTPVEIAKATEDRLVFARFSSFPHWPAKVVVPNQEQRRKLGPLPDNKSCVIFFGKNDYQYISRDRVLPFQPGLAKHKSGKSRLDAAVREALTYLKGGVTVQ